jgi:hypothetical protein
VQFLHKLLPTLQPNLGVSTILPRLDSRPIESFGEAAFLQKLLFQLAQLLIEQMPPNPRCRKKSWKSSSSSSRRPSHVHKLEFSLFGSARRHAAFGYILLTAPRRVHHLIMSPRTALIAERDGTVIDDL